MSYDPLIVGKKFSQVRKIAGINQSDLALELGYSNNSQLSEFENGKAMLPLDKLCAASKILGVPVWVLVNDHEYTDNQIKLIVLFFKKMINSDDFKHKDSIEHLLRS